MKCKSKMSKTGTLRKTVYPSEGGCWFCYTDECTDQLPLVFDTEFDTWVHRECIRVALLADPEHPEARAMRYLIEEEPK